jgi:hypothetical protein
MLEAREGMRVAVITQKRMQNPPLMFEVREGWEWPLSLRKGY